MKRSAALLAAVALAACTMIPDYERPAPPVPEAFPGAQEAGTPAAQLDWREFLADERLRAVVEQALAGNRDLRVATLNVERVGALLSIRRSELWPAIGVQGAGQRIQLPEKMTDSGEAEVVEQYAVEVGFLSWEIDLFGRLRSLSASALEQYLATEEGARAERLNKVRKKDPALDVAATVLDLEVME